MSVELHGRSHPAHKTARMVYQMDHRPCGCQGMQVLKGPSEGHGLNGFDVKGYQNSPSPRASGFAGSRDNCEVQGFRRSPFMGLVSKGTKGPYVSGFQRIEGFPLLSRAFKGFDVFKIQRFQGLREADFKAPRSKD